MQLSRHAFLAAAAAVAAEGISPAPAFAQPAASLTNLRVATPGQDSGALAAYAQEMGYFAKAGLDAQVTRLAKGGGAVVIAAVAGGSYDVGHADLTALCAAYEHGISVTLLSPSVLYLSAIPTPALIVAKNSPFRSARDLDGQIVATASLVGVNTMAAEAWLAANGVDPTRVRFIELAQPEMGTALERGTISAAALAEPNITVAIARGQARLFARIYDSIGPRLMLAAWFSTTDWVKRNSSVARQFVSGMHDAAIWANNPRNHARSALILQKEDDIPDEVLHSMMRVSYATTFDESTMQPLIDAAAKYKVIPSAIRARDLIDPSVR
jgi:NitT/TauT family transport system substrate-binding protein